MWNDEEENNLEKLQTKTLVEQVEDARAEKLAELRANDVTQIDFWVTEAGFISPYPDRVVVYKIMNIRELMKAMYDLTADEKIITGTILSLEEEVLPVLIRIAEDMQLSVGYIANPEVEYEGWEFFTRAAKTLGVLDIAHVFEPLHLPDPKAVAPSEPAETADSELEEEGVNGED